MATAAERTQIIGLVVGMVGAAPGATILAELEALFDGGLSLSAMAEAMATNPAFNGDSGLYPAFLPNAIFATNWVTDLIGDEVSAANLQLAIDAVTAELNAGTSRGAIMFAAINAVAAVAVTDPDFGAAAQALLNKTEVAEYYSVTVAQSGATLADLQAALAGVDSTAASVTTANAAIDTAIAANAELADLIANLDAANDAKTDYLATLEANAVIAALDPTPATPITQADVVTLAGGAELATEAAILAADPGGSGADYDTGSDALKAALIADAQAQNATDVAAANAALATAKGSASGTASITGLPSAISSLEGAIASTDTAIDAALVTLASANAALANYNTLNGTAITLNANGTTSGAEIIISGTSLVLGAGITEAANPGITALLAASQANEAADAVVTASLASANSALDVVENLDLTGVGTRAADLATLTGLFNFITPATAGAATEAEIAAEIAALQAGNAQLQADLLAVTYQGTDADTLAAVQAIVDAAEAAGFIDAADDTAIIAAFGDDGVVDADFDPAGTGGLPAALAAAAAAVPGNSNLTDVLAAQVTYLAGGTALVGGEDLPTALALTNLALVAANAQVAVDDAVELGTDLADAIAAEDLLAGAEEALDDLDDAIADAQAAFGAAGFAVPVTLNSAVKAATVADDVFLTGGINSQIISFAGDDQLFIGSGLTLNADTTAGDNGDNSVLEVWITGTTNAVITIETSVFGSEAATPETYAITLTGVAAADVVLSADGIITLA